MRVELRDPTNYFAILRAIASGNRTFGRIVDATGLDKSLISKYLAVLQNIKIVERELPVPSSIKTKVATKKGLYRITDNFFTFWFTYVFPFKSELESGDTHYIAKYVKETFNEYMSQIYEKLVLAPYIATKLVPFHYTDIGRWWFRDKEIDMVAINRTTNEIFFGEVKWGNLTSIEVTRTLKQLRNKAKFVDWKKENRNEYYGIIALDIKEVDVVRKKLPANRRIYTVEDILKCEQKQKEEV